MDIPTKYPAEAATHADDAGHAGRETFERRADSRDPAGRADAPQRDARGSTAKPHGDV